MSTLSYENFVKKYILEAGGGEIKKIINETENDEFNIMGIIFEEVCKQFYDDYLNNRLDFIDDEDIPENTNNNN